MEKQQQERKEDERRRREHAEVMGIKHPIMYKVELRSQPLKKIMIVLQVGNYECSSSYQTVKAYVTGWPPRRTRLPIDVRDQSAPLRVGDPFT